MFGDKCPEHGSKNDPMAPRTTLECPHEGTSVELEAVTARMKMLPLILNPQSIKFNRFLKLILVETSHF